MCVSMHISSCYPYCINSLLTQWHYCSPLHALPTNGVRDGTRQGLPPLSLLFFIHLILWSVAQHLAMEWNAMLAVAASRLCRRTQPAPACTSSQPRRFRIYASTWIQEWQTHPGRSNKSRVRNTKPGKGSSTLRCCSRPFPGAHHSEGRKQNFPSPISC